MQFFRKKITIIFLFLLCLLTIGCSKNGYALDHSRKVVVWKTHRIGEERIFKMPEADYDSFEVLNIISKGRKELFAKDKNYVYFRGRIIEEANPKKFGELQPDYYTDYVFVYRYRNNEVTKFGEADPQTFVSFGNSFWTKDEKKVYFGEKGFIPADIGSFEILGMGYWARDKFAYYYGSRKVVVSDYMSFQILNDPLHAFAKDNISVYWDGCKVEYCDPRTFTVIDSSSGRDAHFFYSFFRLPKSNGEVEDYCSRIGVKKNKHN